MDERQWWPIIGLAFGTALGFAAFFGGGGAFLLVLLLGVLGYLAGRAVVGELDLSGLVGGTRRRSS
jgi:hypothetical protein